MSDEKSYEMEQSDRVAVYSSLIAHYSSLITYVITCSRVVVGKNA